jgi:CAAX protease family protein
MGNEVITVASQTGAIAVFGILGAVFFRRHFHAKWFIFALVLYVMNDALLTRGFWSLPNFLPDAAWNWQGKVLALVGTLIIASLPQFGLRKIGLTFRQRENSWPAYGLLAVLTLLFFWLAITNPDGRDGWETIAFQWTMPGIEEEIFYRGVLLLAMNEAFTRKVSVLGAPIGYGGVLATVLFGLGHSLSYDGGSLSFDAMTFMITGVPAFTLLWMRERTGSLLLPIIGHNIANGASTLF